MGRVTFTDVRVEADALFGDPERTVAAIEPQLRVVAGTAVCRHERCDGPRASP